MRRKSVRVFLLPGREMVKIMAGCVIMAFTVVNIHMPAQITEGGVLGLTLFLHKVFHFDPVIVSPLLDFLCYALGFSLFGRKFLKRTAWASVGFAIFYKIFLWTGPVVPNLYAMPVLAAILGGIGIGLGCGLVVSQGGAAGGDDALALVISKKFHMGLSRAYLFTDAVVLVLSMVYIPVHRIFFSFMTTTVSSVLIGQFEVKLQSNAVDSHAGV